MAEKEPTPEELEERIKAKNKAQIDSQKEQIKAEDREAGSIIRQNNF